MSALARNRSISRVSIEPSSENRRQQPAGPSLVSTFDRPSPSPPAELPRSPSSDFSPPPLPACRRFDAKNCTLLNGLMNSTGVCIFREQVDNVTWAALNATATSRRMPADEFFQ